MNNIIISILITITTLSIDIFTDLKLWKKEKPVNHFRGALLRLIGLFPACFFGQWFSGVLIVGYWIIFNSAISKLKGLSFWYVGNTSSMDKFINRFPKWVYPLAQVVLLAGAIWIYLAH